MKVEPLRWTLGLAATEFGVDRRTLSTRAKTSGQVPGEDGKFSTRQIAAIAFGDFSGEKLRKLRAEADLAELERDQLTNNVVPIEVVDDMGSRLIKGILAIVHRSDLSEEDKNDVQEEVRAMVNGLSQHNYAPPPAVRRRAAVWPPRQSDSSGKYCSHY